jgi:hypothetical protein
MLRRTTCQKNDRLNNIALEARCFAHAKLPKRKFSRNFLRSFLGWECDATHGVSTGLKTQYELHIHKVSFMTAVPDGNERQSLCCLLNEISLAIQPNVFIATSSNLDLYHSWCCSDCGDVMVAAPAAAAGLQQWAEAVQTQLLIICDVVLLAISHVQTQCLFIFVRSLVWFLFFLVRLLHRAQVLHVAIMQHPAFMTTSKE